MGWDGSNVWMLPRAASARALERTSCTDITFQSVVPVNLSGTPLVFHLDCLPNVHQRTTYEGEAKQIINTLENENHALKDALHRAKSDGDSLQTSVGKKLSDSRSAAFDEVEDAQAELEKTCAVLEDVQGQFIDASRAEIASLKPIRTALKEARDEIADLKQALTKHSSEITSAKKKLDREVLQQFGHYADWERAQEIMSLKKEQEQVSISRMPGSDRQLNAYPQLRGRHRGVREQNSNRRQHYNDPTRTQKAAGGNHHLHGGRTFALAPRSTWLMYQEWPPLTPIPPLPQSTRHSTAGQTAPDGGPSPAFGRPNGSGSSGGFSPSSAGGASSSANGSETGGGPNGSGGPSPAPNGSAFHGGPGPSFTSTGGPSSSANGGSGSGPGPSSSSNGSAFHGGPGPSRTSTWGPSSSANGSGSGGGGGSGGGPGPSSSSNATSSRSVSRPFLAPKKCKYRVLRNPDLRSLLLRTMPRRGPQKEDTPYAVSLDGKAVNEWNMAVGKLVIDEYLKKDPDNIININLVVEWVKRLEALRKNDSKLVGVKPEEMDAFKAKARQADRSHFEDLDVSLKLDFAVLLGALSGECMSSDDEGTSSARTKLPSVVRKDWRYKDLIALMKWLDYYAAAHSISASGTPTGRTTHAHLRTFAKDGASFGKVIAGLPSNFFNPSFLATLDEIETTALAMKPIITLPTYVLTWPDNVNLGYDVNDKDEYWHPPTPATASR
ncbi:hypothetical protein C8F04DRAFT_1195972 [Mycena alexandri]|uniref:Uncharacterized protein n=1 Tax=Mycena alexandri TaxID=1745969 RepID=A0AAD6S728_9AGAR|nr:hypothetical protein C8F04DRAFT_1195972 [Mycena alexandri]